MEAVGDRDGLSIRPDVPDIRAGFESKTAV